MNQVVDVDQQQTANGLAVLLEVMWVINPFPQKQRSLVPCFYIAAEQHHNFAI